MLHELLVAMAGCPGDIFVEYPPLPLPAETLCVRPDFPLLHPAERESLNRLARLGFYYSSLRETTQRLLVRSPVACYTRALAAGLDLVLAEYMCAIAAADALLRTRSDLAVVPVSALLADFGRHMVILPYLYDLLARRDSPAVSTDADAIVNLGSRWMDHLIPQLLDGCLEISIAVDTLLRPCLAVFVHQFAMLVLHGFTHDPLCEFFIAPAPQSGEFVLLVHRVPAALVPSDLGASMLFCVQSAQMIRQAAEPTTLLNKAKVVSLLSELANLADPTSTTTTASAKVIFRPLDFHPVIAKLHRLHSNALWSLVSSDGQLAKMLSFFRDVFLGGNGDFLVDLIDLYSQSTRSDITFSQHRFNLILQTAWARSFEGDLVFNFSPCESLAENINPRFFTRSGLSCNLDWPLSLVVTQEQVRIYARVFDTLATLRAVHRRLASLPRRTRSSLAMLRCVENIQAYFHTETTARFNALLAMLSEPPQSSRSKQSEPRNKNASHGDDDDKYKNNNKGGTLSNQNRDLGALVACHAEFVTNTAKLVFLDHPLLRKTVETLVTNMNSYVSAIEESALPFDDSGAQKWVTTWAPMGSHTKSSLPIDASIAEDNFNSEIKFFIFTLNSLKYSASTMPVHHLLLRLDYNYFWSLGPLDPEIGNEV